MVLVPAMLAYGQVAASRTPTRHFIDFVGFFFLYSGLGSLPPTVKAAPFPLVEMRLVELRVPQAGLRERINMLAHSLEHRLPGKLHR